jgi:hypothetical protein
MLQALVAFLPVALTFPENPNSIDSPLAWHPLSTGIGKLPPGSLRAWWDASKLNANDIYWGYPNLAHNDLCGTQYGYSGSSAENSNVMTINGSQFLRGAAYPGLLFKLEGDTNDTLYRIDSILNSNTFIIAPSMHPPFINSRLYVAQLVRWPDASGNREDMGFWAVGDTYTPGIYILDGVSGAVYRDGHIYHYGNGAQRFVSLTPNDTLGLGYRNYSGFREAVTIHEMFIGLGDLNHHLRQNIEGYLAWKWQIADRLPKQHLYASSLPSNIWSPAQLGNDLQLWLDANHSSSLFSDNDCMTTAEPNSTVGCWKDLSPYQRNLYQSEFGINSEQVAYRVHQGLAGVSLQPMSPNRAKSMSTQEGAMWLNEQNFFLVIVAQKEARPYYSRYVGGPVEIGSKRFFPFIHNLCIGTETVENNPNALNSLQASARYFNCAR